ncbi:PTS sugar transporter subunit IIA [Clostridium estertheticum]|uniref:PTS sugar transporter subunit IIA n=1 Tax=Clostridium estertheticum TaxID=238834 RepID=UPI001C7D3437|nr:PTS sugar transporter subunit IIA [Clostridium estertheticum]MBX4258742.1 PTS sugar transporter subunit IIA [Clostridium estertheticum]WLC69245.1 PTS sugar transporter subunit IIA [Clostridium estertheticum]
MNLELCYENVFVFRDLEFSNSIEALNFLSSKLYEKGYVKKDFQKSIIEREEKYPTGLPSREIKIAIPHATHTLVNEAALSIGILKSPVEFKSMGDSNIKLNVQIIIMLALKEPHGHIEMLQRIVKLIKTPEALKLLVNASSIEEVLNTLKPYLINNKNYHNLGGI